MTPLVLPDGSLRYSIRYRDPAGRIRRRNFVERADAEAVRKGLSDRDADRWALRAGFHPAHVWGWAWVEVGLALGEEAA